MGLAAFSEQLFHHVGSTDAEDWQERERERERGREPTNDWSFDQKRYIGQKETVSL